MKKILKGIGIVILVVAVLFVALVALSLFGVI